MTIDRITTALNKGGQHLGDILYWTWAEARIDRSTLENIWTGAQLAPEYLPDPPTAEKALKATVREAAVGQPDRLIRLGKEDEAEIVFAVLRETRHGDRWMVSFNHVRPHDSLGGRTPSEVYRSSPRRFGPPRFPSYPPDW